MKKKLLTLFMGTALILAACGGGNYDNESAEGGTSSAGDGDAAEIYKNKCSGCHGEKLEGVVGPKLNDIGSRLSKEDIEKVIEEGKGSMPSKIVTGDDAAKVAEWLAGKK
ncbi:cytochrome c551 [Peribacillus sp. SCS-155]|uniref:cytochrome c551 n=1 Tax=Peribacillus sedimenti TaxID=3115297 RepID=UPI0039063E48